jgi:hypothetical protein
LSKSPRPAKSKKPRGATAAETDFEADAPKPAPKAASKSATTPDSDLSARLPTMTDYQLRAFHMSTARISRDDAHPKSAAAKIALPLVEKEISRRATSPGVLPTPPRVGVASPKSDIRKGRGD